MNSMPLADSIERLAAINGSEPQSASPVAEYGDVTHKGRGADLNYGVAGA